MIRVFERTSASSAKRYYTADLANADFAVLGWQVVSFWNGKGAETLGLTGPVGRTEFGNLCDNLTPDGRQKLTPRTRALRRVGYDLCFDCPKSLSVLYAMTRDERILGVFREAVEETMRRMEADAQVRVRRGGKSEDRLTGSLVWGTFIHLTTRPVDGFPDPHVHAHVFLFNSTFDPVEERWKALQFGSIYRDIRFHEATFDSVLVERMMSLGYPVTADGKFWRVEGVPRSVDEKFSRRAIEIKAKVDDLGIKSPVRAAEAGPKMRKAKLQGKPWNELFEHWKSRLSLDERAALDKVISSGIPQQPPMTARRALELAHAECFEQSGVVLERTLLASASRHGIGIKIETLEDELSRFSLLKRTGPDRIHLVDGNRLQEEREMLAIVRQGRGTCRPFIADAKALDDLPASVAEPLGELLKSSDSISLVKVTDTITTASQTKLRALEHPVHEFHGMPGIVLKPKGDDAISRPWEAANGTKRPVWWVNNSQRLGLTQLLGLFSDARKQNARVVLAIAPGRLSRNSPLRLLQSKAGAKIRSSPSLQELFAEQRKAARAWQSGRHIDAVQVLDSLGGTHQFSSKELVNEAANAYVAAWRRSSLTWVETNSDLTAERVNRAVRDLLSRLKKLGRSRRFERLDEVQVDDKGRRISKGNVVIFNTPASGFRPGRRYVVVGRDPVGIIWVRDGVLLKPLLMKHVERFNVYARSDIELAKGDVIRLTRRGKTIARSSIFAKRNSKRSRFDDDTLAKRQYHVDKDSLHRIAGFTLGGHIKLENGWILDKDHGHWNYGYARAECENQEMQKGRPVVATLHARDGRGRRLEGLFSDDMKRARRSLAALDGDVDPGFTPRLQRERTAAKSRGFDYGR